MVRTRPVFAQTVTYDCLLIPYKYTYDCCKEFIQAFHEKLLAIIFLLCKISIALTGHFCHVILTAAEITASLLLGQIILYSC